MYINNNIHYKKESNKHNNINMKINMKINKKDGILDFIKKERVITSSELAKFLKISWNTAQSYLMEFALEGKIERIKKEGVNLWMLK